MESVEKLEVKYGAVRDELVGLRGDLRRLDTKVEAVVRLEGDLKRQYDALHRIGAQVDDHEVRLRSIETTGERTRERLRGHASTTERVWWLIGLVLAAALGAAAKSAFTV